LEEQLPLLLLAYRPPTHEDARQDGVPERATFACNLLRQHSCCPHPSPQDGVPERATFACNLLRQDSCCPHPSPSSAEVKNVWDYTAKPPYVFKLWCLITNTENLTFPTFTYERCINYDRKNIVT
jgi:hypothetical protein